MDVNVLDFSFFLVFPNEWCFFLIWFHRATIENPAWAFILAFGQETSAASWIDFSDYFWIAQPIRSRPKYFASHLLLET
jgi:hypothetical protein